MRDAKEILGEQFLTMRARCLMLAADFDRLKRASGGAELLNNDGRLALLRQAMAIACDDAPDRAPRVETLFSDQP